MNNARGHLLVLAPLAPWPIREGLTLRMAELIQQLAVFWEITLIAPESPSHTMLEGQKGGRKCPVDLRENIVVKGRKEQILEHLGKELVAQTRRLKPDVVLIFRLPSILDHSEIGSFPPTIFDLVDGLSLHYWKDFLLASTLRQRLSAIRGIWRSICLERRLVKSFDFVTVVGETDAQSVMRMTSGRNIRVISNGVHIGAQRNRLEIEVKPTVVFSGVMEFPPNIDAALYFAQQVFPLVKARVPEAEFWIIGRSPVREIRDLHSPGSIRVVADVPDMFATIRRAWVSVAPMRSGAGVKNKVLEAWSVGLPVVMTEFAVNGLSVEPRNRTLVIESKEGMAEAISWLLRDQETAFELGELARKHVADNQSWKSIGEKYHELLCECCL